MSLMSCIDNITLNYVEEKTEFLIVSAELRNIDTHHTIELKINSNEARAFQANFPLTNAEVYILENQSERYDFTHSEKGRYHNLDLRFVPGNTYELNLNYEGQFYKSSPEYVLPSVPITSMKTFRTTEPIKNSAGNIRDADFIHLMLNANNLYQDEAFFKYRIYGTYAYKERVTSEDFEPPTCYVNELIDFDNIALAAYEKQNDVKNQVIIKRKLDYRYAHNYCMKVYQERISKNAYNFWNLVKDEFSRKGDIFETPPGIIRGNIFEVEVTSNPVIGLFSIKSIDSLNHLIYPFDAGFPESECGLYASLPESCTNCLLIYKSTLIKPECFQ
jgi:hypothetical protein